MLHFIFVGHAPPIWNVNMMITEGISARQG